MFDFISVLKEKPMFIGSKGATDTEIAEAEKHLSISFSRKYKHYLSSVGFAIYEGHEITGICKAKRLNVVDVTIMERDHAENIPANWYVIEQLHIDGIVIKHSQGKYIRLLQISNQRRYVILSLNMFVCER